MNPLDWLKKIFIPANDPEDTDPIEEDQPFAFGAHIRIILAILISIVSAGVIWWILA